MAGKSKQIIHPYIELLMEQNGCENIAELAEKTGLPDSTIRNYAFKGAVPRNGDTRFADALGISFADLLYGLTAHKQS
jgi:hypothetical protein